MGICLPRRHRHTTYAGAMQILGEYNAPVLDAIAWYRGNSGGGVGTRRMALITSGWRDQQHPHQRAGTHPVATKAPYPWGALRDAG